jgi:hypothetical protein
MLARCFMVARLASMKRSTQLARQVCSDLSSAAERIVLEVMHFFQQIEVSSWVSVCWFWVLLVLYLSCLGSVPG